MGSTTGDQRAIHVVGRLEATNHVQFDDVMIQLDGGQPSREYVIRGLRVNALQLGVSSTLEATKITAFIRIDIDSGDLIHVMNPTVIVARVGPTGPMHVLSLPSSDRKISRRMGSNSGFAKERGKAVPSLTFAVKFPEHFPGVFKSRAEERSRAFAVEGTSQAIFGLRFLVVFTEIPSGIEIYVTIRDLETWKTNHPNSVLIQSNLLGDLSTQPVEASDISSDGIPIARLNGTGDRAIATWEWVGRTFDVVQSVSFGLVIVVRPNAASLGAMMVQGYFAPLSNVASASPIAPVPRFGDLAAAQKAIEIVD